MAVYKSLEDRVKAAARIRGVSPKKKKTGLRAKIKRTAKELYYGKKTYLTGSEPKVVKKVKPKKKVITKAKKSTRASRTVDSLRRAGLTRQEIARFGKKK